LYPQKVTLTFAQPARRNFTVPILSALAILGIALAGLLHYTPHSTANVTIKNIAVYPSHIVFKSESLVVGRDTVEDTLYLLVNLHIENRRHMPLFIKDFTATLTPADDEPITTSAVEKPDIPNLYTSFPQLKSLADQQAAPLLLRETQIDINKSADGTILIHFPVSQSTWDQRKSATITIDLYHQYPITIPIPKP
jgi:hypothetical protein